VRQKVFGAKIHETEGLLERNNALSERVYELHLNPPVFEHQSTPRLREWTISRHRDSDV